jgi:hypothetical protein
LLKQTNKQANKQTKPQIPSSDSMSTHTIPNLRYQSSSIEYNSQLTGDYQPTANDVLCGRGKALARHPGNLRFAKTVRANLRLYSISKKRSDKTLVVAAVVSTLREQGVRFIKKDSKSTAYIVLSEEQAKEKAGHAIRDLLKTINARQRNGARKHQLTFDLLAINGKEGASPPLTPDSKSLSSEGLDFEDELGGSIHSLLSQSEIVSSELELSEALDQDDWTMNNARRTPKRVPCNDEPDLSPVKQQYHGVVDEVLSFDPATCGNMMREQQQQQHVFDMREQQQQQQQHLAASIHSLLPLSKIVSSALELSADLDKDDRSMKNVRRTTKRVSFNCQFDLSLVEPQGHGVIDEVLSFDPATFGNMMREQQQQQHIFNMREQQQQHIFNMREQQQQQQQHLFKMEEQYPAEFDDSVSLDAALSRNEWREEPLDDSGLPLPITSDSTIECMDMWSRVQEILSDKSPPQPREFMLFPPASRSRSI